jgi:putative ABC transport system substrate-binding protein
VRLKVDIILVTGGSAMVRATKNATKTIPIVMAGAAPDPVKAGLVESLARPGGNVTGITILAGEPSENGLSCSKRPSPRLRVSPFSMTRPARVVHSM